MEFQNNLADAFFKISNVWMTNFKLMPTNEKSQERADVHKNACKDFVTCLHLRLKYYEKAEPSNERLMLYEKNIIDAYEK